MLVPSIDIQNGQAVQLIGGKAKALDAGDPLLLAHRFRLAGEIAVIDLDAAMGCGSNEAIIEKMLRVAPCRVGGGIRSLETAVRWLDRGAAKVILGTKATPDLLSKLPKDRTIAAVDAVNDEVVDHGWTTRTGVRLDDRLSELSEFTSGFLVTFVEKEGRMEGTRLDRAAELLPLVGGAKLTVAGGISTAAEIAALDELGVDSQVGMAIYTGALGFADALVAPLLTKSPDELWPTVVCDEHEQALGLVWSNLESVREAVNSQAGVYLSRRRGVWKKGETSGATQDLLRVELDCDRDALRFIVRQHGSGFCHNNTWTCWGKGSGLSSLFRNLYQRKETAPCGSYTKRLLNDKELLALKLREEIEELILAETKEEAIWEAADVLYFLLVSMCHKGISLAEVETELELRSRRVTRRPGNAKT